MQIDERLDEYRNKEISIADIQAEAYTRAKNTATTDETMREIIALWFAIGATWYKLKAEYDAPTSIA